MMTFTTLLLGLTLGTVGGQDAPKPPAMQLSKVQFMIFLNGDAAPNTFNAEQMDKMQQGHLDNMQRLMNEGKMLIGGPVSNSKFMRGIAVLDLPDKAAVEKAFATDPFVTSKVMKIQVLDWYCLKETMHRPTVMTDLEQFTLGILVKGPNYDNPRTEAEAKKVQEGHMANINKMAEMGLLKVAGPIGTAGDIRGLFFFADKDIPKLQKLCDVDPAVSTGRLKVDLYPLFMGKGSLGK